MGKILFVVPSPLYPMLYLCACLFSILHLSVTTLGMWYTQLYYLSSKVLQGINCSINVSTSQDICEDVVEILHVKMHLKQEKDIGM